MGDTACFPKPVTDDMVTGAIMEMEVAPVALQIDEIIREEATESECQCSSISVPLQL
jgi:hypothetical protein